MRQFHLLLWALATIVNFADNIRDASRANDNRLNLPFIINLQDSIVNDAVNSRIDQNSINVPIINTNQLNSQNEILSTDINL